VVRTLTSKDFNKIFDSFFVFITCLIIIVKIYGLFNLNFLFLVVFFIYLVRNVFLIDRNASIPGYTWLDVAVLLIAVAEGVSYAASMYCENSFYSVVEISFLVLFFYWIKFNLKHNYQRTMIYLFISGLGVLISIEGVLSLLSGYIQMKEAGFSDLSDFRHIIYVGSSAGSPTGEWITLYLAFLPFSFIVLFEKFRKGKRESFLLLIPVILILIIPVLSCFRGMYLALASFTIIGSSLFLLYKLASLKKVILFNAVFLLSLGLMVVPSPFFKPVLTTFSMFQTTSQVRSYEGRKSLWKSGVEIIMDHPVSGIGANNFPIRYVTYKDQSDDAPFIGRVFNFLLQVAIEKGLIGLCAYCVLILAFFFISHRKIKLLQDDWNQRVVVVLFISTFAAIMVRDLTYSSILSNKGVHLLLWFMLAHNAQLPNTKNSLQKVSTGEIAMRKNESRGNNMFGV
jgi:O-antigen ligase